jgi:hypothetical protein
MTRANRGQLEIGPGALEAGAGDVPAELRSLELGVGEASLAVEPRLSLEFACRVVELSAEAHHVGALEADPLENGQDLACLHAVSFGDLELLDHDGRTGRTRHPDYTVARLEPTERGDARRRR